jgi:hypothetical protein
MANAQMLPTPIELMKLQLHRQAEWERESSLAINMSGLNACLFPAPLPLVDPLQRPAARRTTKALQGASPLRGESFVAPRSVARVLEKNVLW